MDQAEPYEDTRENKKNKWLPYPKNDVSSNVFCYARSTKAMEELTVFGMKNSSTLPSLATYVFNSLGDENDEPIYTYNDEYMRFFERKSLKAGRCANLKSY